MVIALTRRMWKGLEQCATKFVHNVSWTYAANKQIAAKCNILPCTFQNQEVNDMTYSTGNTSHIATWVPGQISNFPFSVRPTKFKRKNQTKKLSPYIPMYLSRVNYTASLSVRTTVYSYLQVWQLFGHSRSSLQSVQNMSNQLKRQSKYNRLFSSRVVGV